MPKNLHHYSYRQTEFNTNLADDIFQCPDYICGCQITGVRFAIVINDPFDRSVKCPRCSKTSVVDFIQVNK